MKLPEIEAAKIVRLEPGDIVVLKIAKGRPVTSEELRQIKDLATPAFPGHEIVVVSDMDVAVVRPQTEQS